MPNNFHVYVNNNVASFLYDRPECRSTGGKGDHKCDVILVEFTAQETSKLWIIECKSSVSRQEASKAIEQIEGCHRVINNAGKWEIKNCVIANSFTQDAAISLKKKQILHLQFNNNTNNEEQRNIINAVKKIKGCADF